MKFTAKFIDEALRAYYDAQAKYMVSNTYCFGHGYGETDFLVTKTGNGYCYDVEIKVTIADYKKDFEKLSKHEILETGYYFRRWQRKQRLTEKKYKAKSRPNRFYFAVPEGMIKKEEVPDYAGLLYINEHGGVTKIKEGKLLHKTKIDIEKVLCRKFYFQLQTCKQNLELVKKELKNCYNRKK